MIDRMQNYDYPWKIKVKIKLRIIANMTLMTHDNGKRTL